MHVEAPLVYSVLMDMTEENSVGTAPKLPANLLVLELVMSWNELARPLYEPS